MLRALPWIALASTAASVLWSATPQTPARPFLSRNCFGCHNSRLKSGGLDLQVLAARPVSSDAARWERVQERIARSEMPPPPLPRPDATATRSFTAWLARELQRAEAAEPANPGRITARRLNRYEYNNTVRDLTGMRVNAAADFPADDSGYGFDNIADVLTVSPVLMEKYLRAAERIAARAIVVPGERQQATVERHKAEVVRGRAGESLAVDHDFPRAAQYELRAGLGGIRPAGFDAPVKVTLAVDGSPIQTVEIDPRPDKQRTFDVRVPLTPGVHRLRVRIDAAGFLAGEHPVPAGSRHLVVDWLEVRGPFPDPQLPLPPSHRRLIACGHDPGKHTAACARGNVAVLLRRAWRRDVSDAEVSTLLSVMDADTRSGRDLEQGMRTALEAVLVSSQFLFRIERDRGAGSQRVSGFELASRLSYFLWSSMPDDELLRLGAQNTLHQPAVLRAQVARMLSDPKSASLAENFAAQWLQTRNLFDHQPDPERFPGFDADLRDAMYEETRRYFETILEENRSLVEFIDSDWTWLNGRLARHYGIAGVEGEDFRRVTLNDRSRGGLLTQASVLTVSSYATRTSPVIRGKWVLENFLNAPPPPPPANVPSLDEESVGSAGSLRQQLEKHRASSSCSSCHTRMDPLGFGLENYDATGAWRTSDGKFAIDASGTLPDGRSFRGGAELKQILKGDAPAFAECVAEKMLTYALGRGIERYDRRAVRSIVERVKSRNYRFGELIYAVVESMPFQMRKGES